MKIFLLSIFGFFNASSVIAAQISQEFIDGKSCSWNLIVENHSNYRASIFWVQDNGTEGNVIVDPNNNINIGAVDSVLKVRIQAVGDYQQYSVCFGKYTGGWLSGCHDILVESLKREPPSSDRNCRIHIYSGCLGTRWHIATSGKEKHGCIHLPILKMFQGDWLQGIINNPFVTRNPMDAFPGSYHVGKGKEVLPSHILNVDRYYANDAMIRNTFNRLLSQWDQAKFQENQSLVAQIVRILHNAHNNIGKELAMVREGKSVSAIQSSMQASTPFICK
jgi:hypothetical protein